MNKEDSDSDEDPKWEDQRSAFIFLCFAFGLIATLSLALTAAMSLGVSDANEYASNGSGVWKATYLLLIGLFWGLMGLWAATMLREFWSEMGRSERLAMFLLATICFLSIAGRYYNDFVSSAGLSYLMAKSLALLLIPGCILFYAKSRSK